MHDLWLWLLLNFVLMPIAVYLGMKWHRCFDDEVKEEEDESYR